MKVETKQTAGGERQGVTLTQVPYKFVTLENTGDAALAEAMDFIGNDTGKAARLIVDAVNDAARTEAVNASGVSDINSAIAYLKRVGKDVTPERVRKIVEVKQRQRGELEAALA